MGDLPILKHASKEVLAAGLLEASDAIDWAIKRIADLERQLAESEHDCQAAIENDIKHQLKLAEAKADGERLKARIALAIEATGCCTSCVRTWLCGDLDEEQERRVSDAIDAAREEG